MRLPRGLCADIDRSAWRIPRLFTFLQETGRVERNEMYRVFNMGIGLVVMVRNRDKEQALRVLRAAGEKPRIIGRIESGNPGFRFQN